MKIDNLISRTPPLKTSDTVEHALAVLMEFRVRHLPVVDDAGILVGLISENQLLDAYSPDDEVRALLGPNPLSARPDFHLFDITKIIVDHELTALPVTGPDGQYKGLIERHDIFDQFARMLSTHQPGAILALEIEPRDYSLARLIHTIEQNDVKVLSVASEPESSDGTIQVTLKLNVTDATRVRHMLEHHGYHVVASFGESEDNEDLMLRIQEFMRYLEV